MSLIKNDLVEVMLLYSPKARHILSQISVHQGHLHTPELKKKKKLFNDLLGQIKET